MRNTIIAALAGIALLGFVASGTTPTAIGPGVRIKTGLTDAASNDFVRIGCPVDGHVGGQIHYTVHAGNATDVQVRSGTVAFAIVNDDGAETGDVQTAFATEATVASTGTITASFGITNNAANSMDVDITPTSSLTTTVLEIHFRVVVDEVVTITDL